MSVLKYKHPTLGWVPVSGVTEDSSKLVKGPLRWTVTEGAQVLYRKEAGKNQTPGCGLCL